MNGTGACTGNQLATCVNYLATVAIGSGTISGNLLIICASLWSRSLRNKGAFIILGLALADCLTGVARFSLYLGRLGDLFAYRSTQPTSVWECVTFSTVLMTFSRDFQGWMMVAVNADRLFAVSDPLRYLGVPKQYPFIIVLGLGAYSSLFTALGIFEASKMGPEKLYIPKCLTDWMYPKWYNSYRTACVLLTGYLSVLLYVVTFAVLRLKNLETLSQLASDAQKRSLRKQRELTKVFGIVTICTMIFHNIPYTLAFFRQTLGIAKYLTYFYMIASFNTTCNVVIYVWRFEDVRKAMKAFLSCRNPGSVGATTIGKIPSAQNLGSARRSAQINREDGTGEKNELVSV